MEGVQFLEAWVCLALNYSVLNRLVVSGLFAVSELEEDLDGVFFEESSSASEPLEDMGLRFFFFFFFFFFSLALSWVGVLGGL